MKMPDFTENRPSVENAQPAESIPEDEELEESTEWWFSQLCGVEKAFIGIVLLVAVAAMGMTAWDFLGL